MILSDNMHTDIITTNLIDISHTEEIYTVSRLNREVRFTLESNFLLLWVEGEVSNFMCPQSGHWYFSLKDTHAQVRCAMFKPQNRKLNFIPKDGMHIIVKAKVTLYEGRGDYQILVEHMEDAGVGKLQKEFEALKKKLTVAGLFLEKHKKPLPAYPKTIGVVTSPTGAAIRDILSVIKRRYSCAHVIIYPTLVQGDQASKNIVSALNTANERNECDVIILARGGGSLEDLWPFNEENVAYAIFNCTIPIISGIGHEIDFSIADFAADVRAPTPSVAAEMVTPNKDDLVEMLTNRMYQLLRLINQHQLSLQKQLNWIQKNLYQQHPKRRLAEQRQQLDYSEIALVKLQTKIFTAYTSRVEHLQQKLLTHNPKHIIRDLTHQIKAQEINIQKNILNKLQSHKQLLANLAGKLDALSPLATLQRGFAIATSTTNNNVLTNTKQTKIGDKINLRLLKGNLICNVDEINR